LKNHKAFLNMKTGNKQNRESFRPFRVLVIEDNQDVAANIGDFLEEKGHVVDFAMDGISGLHLAVTQPIDVMILDIMLPGMDGMTLCRQFREKTETSIPILMLTAKDTLDDKLEGFEAGADDYLLKPFELQELEARLQALVRRSRQDDSRTFTVGAVSVDMGRRSVTVEGRQIHLNRTCFRILVELLHSAPDVVTREDLEHLLWGDARPASDALRSHIYALRQAIDPPGKLSFIETVTGIGFKVREQS
jgi:DNA-binding response OmpR family regulator